MSARAVELRADEEDRWGAASIPGHFTAGPRPKRTDADLWRSLSLDVARGIPEVVRMGVVVIVDERLDWDEIVPMPSFMRLVVGEQDHLRWKLRLNEERRQARLTVDRIGLDARIRLGLPW